MLPDPSSSLDPSRSREAQQFLLRLARGLHEQGTPSHRLEEALMALCRRLQTTGHFFSTPTAIFASFEGRERNDVHLLRVGYGDVDLGRLSDFDEVATSVASGQSTARQALEALDRIEREPTRYGALQMTPAYALNSAAASVIFGGGVPELLTALAIGLTTGLLAWVSGRSGQTWRAFEPMAAFFAAVIATVAARYFGPVSIMPSLLGGLIALIPGYTLTVAIAELANRHLASGSARATAAFMSFLTLGFGVALGTKFSEFVVGVPTPSTPEVLSGWAEALSVAVGASTFAVLFKVKRRDFPWVFTVAVLGFCGARIGSRLLGPELGVFLGAFTAGVSSNVFARVMNRPAVVPLFPGIMLLVPGSIGFRSLSSLIAHDVVSGVQTAFTMILVAVALVAGLLLANDVVSARRAL